MKKSFEAALLAQGYEPIICVGFKEVGDDYQIKVATSPALKALSPETWDMLLNTLFGALDRLYQTPLDDLEIQ